MCVAFFWRASEAVLTQRTASALNNAASRALISCAAAQQLPLDLSVLAVCLWVHPDLVGDRLAGSRGIAAFNRDLQWASDPQGHVFRLPGHLPVADTRFVAFWLPARRNV